jgi:hypothetical protein
MAVCAFGRYIAYELLLFMCGESLRPTLCSEASVFAFLLTLFAHWWRLLETSRRSLVGASLTQAVCNVHVDGSASGDSTQV